MQDYIHEFRQSMSSFGLEIKKEIIPNGKIQRFYVVGDKSHSANGWYILFADGIPGGKFGNWKTGDSHAWRYKSCKILTPNEWKRQHQKINEAYYKRELAQRARYKQASIKAEKLWMSSQQANPNHPYLVRKNISPFTARQSGDSLVLPIIDIDGKIWSYQFIPPEEKKGKRLLYGGKKKGNLILINELNPENPILISLFSYIS